MTRSPRFKITPIANGDLIQFLHPGEPNGVVNDELIDHVDSLDPGNLHLDFASVERLGSVGIAKLVRLYKMVRAKHHNLYIFNVKPEVFEVLEVTKLNTLIGVSQSG